jgi:hypothetical protein
VGHRGGERRCVDRAQWQREEARRSGMVAARFGLDCIGRGRQQVNKRKKRRGMVVELDDPCGFGRQVERRRKDFGATPAELTCEARFGLRNRAWLRGGFRSSWAVPRWTEPS